MPGWAESEWRPGTAEAGGGGRMAGVPDWGCSVCGIVPALDPVIPKYGYDCVMETVEGG